MGGYWYYVRVQESTYRPTQFCRCGQKVRIGPGVFISSPQRMIVGDGTWVGGDCAIDATGGLKIGRYCAVASRTTILTVDHQFRGAESIPWGQTRALGPVVIEDYAWVGMNAAILPGVTIGEGAIIGLGAVVAKDVPPRAIVVGNPARVVGYREEEQ